MVELSWDPLPTRGRGSVTAARKSSGLAGSGHAATHAEPDSSETGVYEVERIIDVRGTAEKREYLVKWLGRDASHSSWKREDDLRGVTALERFERVECSEASPWPAVCNGQLVGRHVSATFLDEDGVSQWYPALVIG